MKHLFFVPVRHFAVLVLALLGMLAAQPVCGQVKTQLTTVTLTASPGQELQDGIIYTVTSDMTIEAPNVGQCALTVTKKSVATIYIARGCKLTVKGHDGDGRIPATPAIYVPYLSTLVITGEGSLEAYGGNAGRGGNGEKGKDGWLDWRKNQGRGGAGGAGGTGGGGAAPAIGAIGGYGAYASTGPDGNVKPCDGNKFDGNGNKGQKANQGFGGEDMGVVYILGSVEVNVHKGSVANEPAEPGSGYGNSGTDAGSGWYNNYTSGGGGPGGGGSSGYEARYGIGGGAPGGQSGSSGGSGGTLKNSKGRDHIRGAGGKGGGNQEDSNFLRCLAGKSSTAPASSAWGATGGSAGDVPANAALPGGDGQLYVMNTAHLENDTRRGEENFSLPAQIGVSVYLDANGGTTDQDKVTFYYGVTPAGISVLPTYGSQYFDGYYTQKTGGERVLDATGKADKISLYTTGQTLYAHWYDAYINTTNDNYFPTKYIYNAQSTTVRRMDKTGAIRTDVIVDAKKQILIKGDLKFFEILDNGKVVRRYDPARHEGETCLFEEYKRQYIRQNFSTPDNHLGNNCNHALSNGRSAYHDTSKHTEHDGVAYDVKKCYLCGQTAEFAADNDYVRLNGASSLATQYVPNDRTTVFARIQTDNAESLGTAPMQPYGVQTGTNKYGVQFTPIADDNAIQVYAASGGEQLNEASNVLFGLIDYQLLQDKYGLTVSEEAMKSQSVIAMDWEAKKQPAEGQPLFIGALNNDGQAEQNMKGRIYSFNIIEEGKSLHTLIPAQFEGKAGMYDKAEDKFTAFDNTDESNKASVVVKKNRCPHYYKVNHADGRDENHCQVCDLIADTRFYNDITYHSGEGADGVMAAQTIMTAGHLTPSSFSKPMHKFKGWSKTEKGGDIDYENQHTMQPNATNCGPLDLYALWDECYTAGGDTLAIPSTDEVAELTLYDADRAHHSLATVRPFTARKFHYERVIPTGTTWGTLCLPIALESNDSITYYHPATIQGNKLMLRKAERIEPNTPCIYKVTKSGVEELHFDADNVSITGKVANLLPVGNEDGAQGETPVTLTGTYETLQRDCSQMTCYAFSNDRFYHVTTSVEVNPFHACIFVEGEQQEVRQQLYLCDTDEATGIALPSDEPTMANRPNVFLKGNRIMIRHDAELYDIMGRKQ